MNCIKKITNLPGHVFELGVYKAASLIRFATFINFLENDFSRKIVGFDTFGEFPKDALSLPEDKKIVKKFEDTGGEGLSIQEAKSIFDRKKIENIELIKGNIFETVPTYLQANSATIICLLHLDMDVKEPTAFALQ